MLPAGLSIRKRRPPVYDKRFGAAVSSFIPDR